MINKFYISDAKVLDDRAGIVEAYVNTMGVRDADGDIIDPAAFNASIKSNLPIPVVCDRITLGEIEADGPLADIVSRDV